MISLFFYICSMKKIVLYLIAIVVVASCSVNGNFTKKDIDIIRGDANELLKIYTIESEEETLVLRDSSVNLSVRSIYSEDYVLLVERMKRTVSDSAVSGVGIAAPQIGINKRLVVVQRFDKEGDPFEAYPNISIVEYSDEKIKGTEGCLSVPGEKYDVNRCSSVVINYFDAERGVMVQEFIDGFTAVIFQHEVDHLDGIIYTDRVLM